MISKYFKLTFSFISKIQPMEILFATNLYLTTFDGAVNTALQSNLHGEKHFNGQILKFRIYYYPSFKKVHAALFLF